MCLHPNRTRTTNCVCVLIQMEGFRSSVFDVLEELKVTMEKN